MWVAAGRPSRARRLYEQALQTATGNGEPYPRATADLHVGLAELDRELDDLASAEAHLETARVLAERASITENRHRWPVAMAQVRAARGDHEAAMRLLEQAEALYRHGFYPDVRPIDGDEGPSPDRRGRPGVGSELGPGAGLSVDDDPDYLHEYEHLTLARLLLAQHRADAAADQPPTARRRVLRLLDRLHGAAADAGRDGSLLEIRMLQALAHHAGGDRRQALAVLGRALTEAPEPEQPRAAVPGRGRPDAGPAARRCRSGRAARHGSRRDGAGVQARRLLEHAAANRSRATCGRSSPWPTR